MHNRFRDRTAKRNLAFSFLPLAALGCLQPQLALAQERSDSTAVHDLEEVVVTARKRGDEVLQDVGGSIQVLGGEELAAKAAMGFNDYARMVPGLSANNSGSGQSQIIMRGVSSTRLNHANPNVPETASIYFDESNVTASGFNPDAALVDIARVEVLRGPQGTLFGASSMSGALRIIPNLPRFDEFTVDGKLSAFDTKDGSMSYSGDATLNVPITEKLAVRMSGYSAHSGGYIDNVYSGPANQGGKDFNDEDAFGFRFTGLWAPSDTLRVKLSHLYHENHADGRADEYALSDPLTGYGINSGGSILLPGERIAISDELQIAKFVEETFDDEFAVSALSIEKSFGALTLTSITSYMDRRFENLLDDTYRTRDWISVANESWWDIDRDGSGIFTPGTGVAGVIAVGADPLDPQLAVPVLTSPFQNNTQLERISEELRLVSDFDGPFNFLIGAYYEDERRDFQQNIIVPGLDIWLDNFSTYITTPAFGAQIPDNFFEGRYSFDTTQYALFGELSYEIGAFEVILGGRYFDYSQEGDVFFGGFIEFSEDRLVEEIEEDGFSPKVELSYEATDDVTLYTTYSEGFRLGSVQQFINESACAGSLAGIGLAAAPTTIESDELQNYEVGFKSTLFDGRAVLNASYYYIDWQDARSQVFLGCGWIVEFNAIDIESQGLELNLSTRITDNLLVSANLGTNESEVSRVDPAARMVASVGDRTPMTPELTWSIGFDYSHPLGFNDWDFFVRGDVSYMGDMVSSLGTAAEQANAGRIRNLVVPDNTVGNLHFGLTSERWEWALFVRNVTDEEIVSGIDIDRRGPAAYTRGRPRNFGTTVRFFW